MVTQKGLERYMTNVEQIAKEAETDPEVAKRVIKAIENDMNNRRRQPTPPPPEGGISRSKASRKYDIAKTTIYGWIKRGYIPVLLRTKREVYIQEAKLTEIVNCYKSSPGQGKKTVKRQFAS